MAVASKVRTYELVGRDAVLAWRAAAIADGWAIEPTYAGESADTAFKLKRDGFVVQGCARPSAGNARDHFNLMAWDSRGIALDPFPPVYSMAAVLKLTRHCPECGKDDVDLVRVGFANGACADCAPALRRTIEVGNWAD